jgi:ubiquinone/menaquinone biosynthesis C-methylase UbiE
MQRVLEPEAMVGEEEAASYATMDHAAPNAAFVERLLELGADGQMLDIGTGPGHIPLLLCERLPEAHITAIDLSEAMLRQARALREASPFAARLAFETGDAKALAYDDRAFDTVFSNTILHHIPDPLPFLREARRVLRPGGALLIRDLFRPDTPERADELVALHAADASPEQQRLFRDSLCAAFTPAELREIADRAGLERVELVLDSDRHLSLQLRTGGRQARTN